MTIEIDHIETELDTFSALEEEDHESRLDQNPSWRAINWNNAPEFDNDIWNKLLSQYWVYSAVPVSNDNKAWATLTDAEKKLVHRVFTGLTKLDTVQSRFGAPSLMKDSTTLFEEAVYSQIGLMESIHARSYSYIFTTLSNTRDINEAFRWSDENEWLLRKVNIVMKYYTANNKDLKSKLKKKLASVYLESFLFYSGFYLPLYFNGQAKLTNTADLIRLIMRDEAVHGYYIGAKFQEGFRSLSAEDQEELQDWAYDLLQELYENEIRYTQDLYDELGLTEEVKTFLRYNANRALANLGFDPLFPKEDVNPVILTQMDLTAETADFFSGKGSSYVMNVQEDNGLDEEEWDF